MTQEEGEVASDARSIAAACWDTVFTGSLMRTHVSFQNRPSLLLTSKAPWCENGRHRTGARKGAVRPSARELTGESAQLSRHPSG